MDPSCRSLCAILTQFPFLVWDLLVLPFPFSSFWIPLSCGWPCDPIKPCFDITEFFHFLFLSNRFSEGYFSPLLWFFSFLSPSPPWLGDIFPGVRCLPARCPPPGSSLSPFFFNRRRFLASSLFLAPDLTRKGAAGRDASYLPAKLISSPFFLSPLPSIVASTSRQTCPLSAPSARF